MRKLAEIPEYKYLPPEELLDRYHPNNSEFFLAMQRAKQALVAQQATMKPLHVEIVKQHFRGKRNVDVAEELDITAGTVSKVVNSAQGKNLKFLLQHFAGLNEGPSQEHRKRVLWEIVIDNQQHEPKTAIAALQEMNKMDGIGNAPPPDSEVKIIINQQLLPKGSLDSE
jgi:hypothetical protein